MLSLEGGSKHWESHDKTASDRLKPGLLTGCGGGLLRPAGDAAFASAAGFAVRGVVSGAVLEILLPRRQLVHQTFGAVIFHKAIRRLKQVIGQGLQPNF